MSDRRPGLHVGSLSDPAALELVDGVHLEQPRRFSILVPFLHDDTEKWFLGALDLAGKSILRGQVVSTRQEGIDLVGEDVVWCGYFRWSPDDPGGDFNFDICATPATELGELEPEPEYPSVSEVDIEDAIRKALPVGDILLAVAAQDDQDWLDAISNLHFANPHRDMPIPGRTYSAYTIWWGGPTRDETDEYPTRFAAVRAGLMWLHAGDDFLLAVRDHGVLVGLADGWRDLSVHDHVDHAVWLTEHRSEGWSDEFQSAFDEQNNGKG